jgi:hypothetical protein
MFLIKKINLKPRIHALVPVCTRHRDELGVFTHGKFLPWEAVLRDK